MIDTTNLGASTPLPEGGKSLHIPIEGGGQGLSPSAAPHVKRQPSIRMQRLPIRYAPRQLIGWKAYVRWSPIAETTFQSADAARSACEEKARTRLVWTESEKPTPEGHRWHEGRATPESQEFWNVTPAYRRIHEPIPGAKYVSQDPRCTFYIEPEQDGWAVHQLFDTENVPAEDLFFRGYADTLAEARDAQRLWHFFECKVHTESEATEHAYYLWGRQLVRKNAPPPERSWLKTKLRKLAAAWL